MDEELNKKLKKNYTRLKGACQKIMKKRKVKRFDFKSFLNGVAFTGILCLFIGTYAAENYESVIAKQQEEISSKESALSDYISKVKVLETEIERLNALPK